MTEDPNQHIIDDSCANRRSCADRVVHGRPGSVVFDLTGGRTPCHDSRSRRIVTRRDEALDGGSIDLLADVLFDVPRLSVYEIQLGQAGEVGNAPWIYTLRDLRKANFHVQLVTGE